MREWLDGVKEWCYTRGHLVYF